MEIMFQGKMYNIPRLYLETDQQLISRSWWIMSNLEINNDYDEILLLSKYWHNIFYKHCTYSADIMKRIYEIKYC